MPEREPTITACRIIPARQNKDLRGEDPYARFQGEFQSTVVGEMSDGTTNIVLRFFDDEIEFSPNEFVGLNQFEANALFHKKDIEYLRS